MFKKIALCLRGAVSKIGGGAFHQQDSLYRDYKYVNYIACYNSIAKHIITANPDYSFDTFIHSWNPDLQESIVQLYKPVKYIFESNSLYNEEISKKTRQPKEFGGVSHALSIKKSIELLEQYQLETNIQYDLVIIYRPDVLLIKDMLVSDYDFSKIYMNASISPDPHGDFHFVMNPSFASEFKYLYDSIENGNPCKAHFWILNYVNSFMKQNMLKDNIVAGFHQDVLRKIHTITVKSKGVPISQLLEYGLTEQEIMEYNFP